MQIGKEICTLLKPLESLYSSNVIKMSRVGASEDKIIQLLSNSAVCLGQISTIFQQHFKPNSTSLPKSEDEILQRINKPYKIGLVNDQIVLNAQVNIASSIVTLSETMVNNIARWIQCNSKTFRLGESLNSAQTVKVVEQRCTNCQQILSAANIKEIRSSLDSQKNPMLAVYSDSFNTKRQFNSQQEEEEVQRINMVRQSTYFREDQSDKKQFLNSDFWENVSRMKFQREKDKFYSKANPYLNQWWDQENSKQRKLPAKEQSFNNEPTANMKLMDEMIETTMNLFKREFGKKEMKMRFKKLVSSLNLLQSRENSGNEKKEEQPFLESCYCTCHQNQKQDSDKQVKKNKQEQQKRLGGNKKILQSIKQEKEDPQNLTNKNVSATQYSPPAENDEQNGQNIENKYINYSAQGAKKLMKQNQKMRNSTQRKPKKKINVNSREAKKIGELRNSKDNRENKDTKENRDIKPNKESRESGDSMEAKDSIEKDSAQERKKTKRRRMEEKNADSSNEIEKEQEYNNNELQCDCSSSQDSIKKSNSGSSQKIKDEYIVIRKGNEKKKRKFQSEMKQNTFFADQTMKMSQAKGSSFSKLLTNLESQQNGEDMTLQENSYKKTAKNCNLNAQQSPKKVLISLGIQCDLLTLNLTSKNAKGLPMGRKTGDAIKTMSNEEDEQGLTSLMTDRENNSIKVISGMETGEKTYFIGNEKSEARIKQRTLRSLKKVNGKEKNEDEKSRSKKMEDTCLQEKPPFYVPKLGRNKGSERVVESKSEFLRKKYNPHLTEPDASRAQILEKLEQVITQKKPNGIQLNREFKNERISIKSFERLSKNKIVQKTFGVMDLELFGGMEESRQFAKLRTKSQTTNLNEKDKQDCYQLIKHINSLCNFKCYLYESVISFLCHPYETVESRSVIMTETTSQQLKLIIQYLVSYHKSRCQQTECAHLSRFKAKILFQS